ncbi:MAG: serine/threonine-protein phosphatase [Eubacterium sp.]|nr:serine/threonine-protein phosphatase [Eubacterium sp.]
MLSEGYVIVPVLPESELLDERNFALLTMGAVEITFFVGLFFILFLLFRRHQETTAEAARIEHELSIAKQIQESALPVGVSPFPDRTEFSLHASMDAAREVGGDFYDFFPMDDGRLVFLIADVSGKGIPAAMFMMTSKSLIRSRADQAETLAGVFEQVNDRLCDGNESGMFLTAWMGALDIETGMVRFVNAGHNAPVLIRDGKASFVEQSPGLMLAMMEEMEYTEQLIELVPGDILYLYTDGVTEASKEDESRLGNDRLLEILSGNYGTGEEACRRICETVREQVDVFAEGAEQFDDITQVCLYYEGS